MHCWEKKTKLYLVGEKKKAQNSTYNTPVNIYKGDSYMYTDIYTNTFT